VRNPASIVRPKSETRCPTAEDRRSRFRPGRSADPGGSCDIYVERIEQPLARCRSARSCPLCRSLQRSAGSLDEPRWRLERRRARRRCRRTRGSSDHTITRPPSPVVPASARMIRRNRSPLLRVLNVGWRRAVAADENVPPPVCPRRRSHVPGSIRRARRARGSFPPWPEYLLLRRSEMRLAPPSPAEDVAAPGPFAVSCCPRRASDPGCNEPDLAFARPRRCSPPPRACAPGARTCRCVRSRRSAVPVERLLGVRDYRTVTKGEFSKRAPRSCPRRARSGLRGADQARVLHVRADQDTRGRRARPSSCR